MPEAVHSLVPTAGTVPHTDDDLIQLPARMQYGASMETPVVVVVRVSEKEKKKQGSTGNHHVMVCLLSGVVFMI